MYMYDYAYNITGVTHGHNNKTNSRTPKRSLVEVSRVKMVTTTGTRGVVRGPITSAGVNMGSGLVIMH